MEHFRRGGEPEGRVLLESAKDQLLHDRRDLAVQQPRARGRLLQDRVDELVGLAFGEGTPARDHLEQHYAHGVEVAPFVRPHSPECLRRHVGKRPDNVTGLREALGYRAPVHRGT